MSRIKLYVFGAVVLALSLSVSCGDDDPEGCGPTNCLGCCDALGFCQAGTTSAYCGAWGTACMFCGVGQACTGGTCQAPTCGPHNCAGCCDTSNVCQPGGVNWGCGVGGEACDYCESDYECVAGDCVPVPCGVDWRATCEATCREMGVSAFGCCEDPFRDYEYGCVCCIGADCSSFTCI